MVRTLIVDTLRVLETTERIVDQIAEGVDLAFRVGELEDSSLVARRILTYRHQLVASPGYLQKHKPPKTPQELLLHRLLAFSFWRPENTWKFTRANGKDKASITFKPYLAIFRPSSNLSFSDRDGWSRSCQYGVLRYFTCPYVILEIVSFPGPFASLKISPPRWRPLCSRLSPCGG